MNLESHNKAKNSVQKVFSKEGFLLVEPRKVLGEIKNFYSDLYQKDDLDPSENLINSFLKNSQIRKLLVDKVEACEGKLTIDECFKSLNSFENNKSPGNDGLTAEFYKAFWNVCW